MRIERSVRHTRAVDRRKVTPLEEDMGAREDSTVGRRTAGVRRSARHSPGPYRLSGAMIRVNSPVASSTPTTISSAPDTPAIHA